MCKRAPHGRVGCFAIRVDRYSSGRVSHASSPVGLTPSDLRSAYALPSTGVAAADRRDRRCLRRPERRGRPARLPRAVRPAGLHDRERLLPQGRPERAPGRSRLPTRAGRRRSRSTSTWRRRSARRASLLLVEATSSSQANLGAAVNTAARLGANAISNSYGGPDAVRQHLRPLLPPPGHRGHRVERRQRLRRLLSGDVEMGHRGRRHDAARGRAARGAAGTRAPGRAPAAAARRSTRRRWQSSSDDALLRPRRGRHRRRGRSRDRRRGLRQLRIRGHQRVAHLRRHECGRTDRRRRIRPRRQHRVGEGRLLCLGPPRRRRQRRRQRQHGRLPDHVAGAPRSAAGTARPAGAPRRACPPSRAVSRRRARRMSSSWTCTNPSRRSGASSAPSSGHERPRCVSSPPATASLRCLSCALITSSAVSPAESQIARSTQLLTRHRLHGITTYEHPAARIRSSDPVRPIAFSSCAFRSCHPSSRCSPSRSRRCRPSRRPGRAALRAEVGRLPLHRVPRRRRGRARLPQRAAADPLLPRDRRGRAGSAARPSASSTARSSSRGDGGLDFESLQLRLHPAESRVRKLPPRRRPSSSPSTCSPSATTTSTRHPFAERRALLAKAAGRRRRPCTSRRRPTTASRRALVRPSSKAPASTASSPSPSTCTTAGRARDVQDQARAHRRLRRRRLPLPQERARSSARCCSACTTTTVRCRHVGVAASFTMARRKELLDELRAVPRRRAPVGGATPGTPRKWGPGGSPSRWNAGKDLSFEPLRPELVVEVAYDYMEGERFRHTGQFRRWRPDRDPQDLHLRAAGAPAELRDPGHLGRIGRPVSVEPVRYSAKTRSVHCIAISALSPSGATGRVQGGEHIVLRKTAIALAVAATAAGLDRSPGPRREAGLRPGHPYRPRSRHRPCARRAVITQGRPATST